MMQKLPSFEQVMSIYGKMSVAEAQALCEAADQAGPGPIVELGTFTGRSAALMACAVGDPSRIFTLDNYLYRSGRYQPNLKKNLKRMQEHGIEGIHFLQHDSRRVPSVLEPYRGKVAMLFIDSAHTSSHVDAEFKCWLNMLAPQAIIALHDVGHPKFWEYTEFVNSCIEEWVKQDYLHEHVVRVETFVAMKKKY